MPETPRLRTAEKVKPPYPLNKFTKDFGLKVGRQVIYLIATKSFASLEGPEWEQIFAKSIVKRYICNHQLSFWNVINFVVLEMVVN
jgi:hypothetical protein